MSYKPTKSGKGDKIKIVEVPVYIPQESIKKPDEPPIYKPEKVVPETKDEGPIKVEEAKYSTYTSRQ